MTGGQQPIGNAYRFLPFLLRTWQPRATPIVTRGEGSFSYQGVSTRGVRHSPVLTPQSMHFHADICRLLQNTSLSCTQLLFETGASQETAGNCRTQESRTLAYFPRKYVNDTPSLRSIVEFAVWFSPWAFVVDYFVDLGEVFLLGQTTSNKNTSTQIPRFLGGAR